ncbi:MAG TPA: pectinesterase family protein [Polyangiaceae bacterium]|nr:pectinesterase family protein [Polyangiaceae bacterium]
MRASIQLVLSFGCLVLGVACSGVGADDADVDGASSGGSSSADVGVGGAGVGGSASGGGVGLGGASGGQPATPPDCSPFADSTFQLCDQNETSCGVVFVDGSGCSAVCASAGLTCLGARENSEDSCGANTALPELPCDSGHQSDYCLCGNGESPGSGGAGTGGAGSGGAGTGGAGTGGSPSVSTPDCNQRSELPFLTVAKSGGQFSTVAAALGSLSKSNTTLTVLRIAPGTYVEKLTIDRPNVLLCGQDGKTTQTILSYGDGSDTSNGAGGTLGTSGSASLNVTANRVAFENLTIRNTRGVGAQAVALLVSSNEVELRDCRILGNQDTLYTKGGTQYFKDTYIEGTVDFVFGAATAVFENCTLHSVGGGSALTAPSTDQAVPFGLVFLGGKATAASSVSAGSVHLGRNWRPYGAATYLHTELGAHIAAKGWSPMGENTLATARFAEFQTTGAGAKPASRVAESKQLTAGEAAAYTVENILDPWVPSFSR